MGCISTKNESSLEGELATDNGAAVPAAAKQAASARPTSVSRAESNMHAPHMHHIVTHVDATSRLCTRAASHQSLLRRSRCQSP